MVANWSTTPRKLYGFDGHPGRFTTVLSGRISCAPTAPVGFGSADGIPPHEAHDPMAITAAALLPTSCRMSMAVLPAI